MFGGLNGLPAGAKSKEKPVSKLHKNISIQFLSVDDDPFEVRAEVGIKKEKMVISISEDQPGGPYLVEGELRNKYFFAGVDSYKHEIQVDVKARWALLGDTYVGIWIENGQEYLFMFRLPRASIIRGRA
jgi:hypothetical protein